MKALILTCRFGMGHNTVSKTLEIELKKKGYETIIVDLMDYIYSFASKSIYFTFEYMVKHHPNLYNTAESHSNGDRPPLKKYSTIKIKKLIDKYNADIIVSTFPVCSSYVGAYKERYKKDIKLYTYITDFDPGREWIVKNTDKYFVASFDTKKALLSLGIAPDKIVVSGIPVKEEFSKITKKEKGKNVLILGGGLGIIPEIYDIIDKLLQVKDIKIKVVTGTNKALYKKLKSKYPNIDVIGYTNNMPKYVQWASLIVTKPGGITISEAIRSNTPLCIIKPILKQEIINAKFVLENNMGIIFDKDNKKFMNEVNNLFQSGTINTIKTNMKNYTDKLDNLVPDEYY